MAECNWLQGSDQLQGKMCTETDDSIRYVYRSNIDVQLQFLTFDFSFLAITKEEENYEEAVKAINSCFGGGKPNSILLDILNDPACIHLTNDVRKKI